MEKGPVQGVPGTPTEVAVSVSDLPKGTYTVTWRTVSKLDGHVTANSCATIPPKLTPTTRQRSHPTASSSAAASAA